MQDFPTRKRESPDLIKRFLWIAFLISALITVVLSIRALRSNPEPEGTIQESKLLATVPDDGRPSPTLDDDRLLQGNANRPGYKELDLSKPVYFVFTGLDKREWEGETGPGLTDTIIVAFLDTQKGNAGMISIPRDTWVEVPHYQPYKINQTFSVGEATSYPGGGPALLMETAGNLLDVPIDYYVQVDFKAFIVLVDSVDGVMVDVERKILVDPDPSIEGDMKKLKKGLQVLPGDLALGYVRSRETANGDFDRNKRQQQVLVGLQKKLFSYEILPTLIPKIPELYRELSNHVETNLSMRQIVTLAWAVRDINPGLVQTTVINQPLVEAGFNSKDQYVLFPDTEAIQKVWMDMQQIVATPIPQPTKEPSLAESVERENAKVAVQNATTVPGLASQTADFLETKGIQVVEVGNSDKYKDETFIYDYSGNPSTIQKLFNVMNLNETHLYHRSDPNSSVDVVIVLGADWARKNTLPDDD
jgi:LCP family protein required for cell wall assembly